jgi:Cu-Zn family superoxide dismutase
MPRLLHFFFLLLINIFYSNSNVFAAEVEVQINRISVDGVGAEIGSIILKDNHHGMMLIPNLRALPEGNHAFHIHENPSCKSGVKNGNKIAGYMAGGHFAPKKENQEIQHNYKKSHHGHGKPHGDLPELLATKNGTITTPVMTNKLKVSQLIGRSIIIHRYGESDVGKPKGGGPRYACGVIIK